MAKIDEASMLYIGSVLTKYLPMTVILLYTIKPCIASASMRYVLSTKHERAHALVGENLR